MSACIDTECSVCGGDPGPKCFDACAAPWCTDGGRECCRVAYCTECNSQHCPRCQTKKQREYWPSGWPRSVTNRCVCGAMMVSGKSHIWFGLTPWSYCLKYCGEDCFLNEKEEHDLLKEWSATIIQNKWRKSQFRRGAASRGSVMSSPSPHMPLSVQ